MKFGQQKSGARFPQWITTASWHACIHIGSFTGSSRSCRILDDLATFLNGVAREDRPCRQLLDLFVCTVLCGFNLFRAAASFGSSTYTLYSLLHLIFPERKKRIVVCHSLSRYAKRIVSLARGAAENNAKWKKWTMWTNKASI